MVKINFWRKPIEKQLTEQGFRLRDYENQAYSLERIFEIIEGKKGVYSEFYIAPLTFFSQRMINEKIGLFQNDSISSLTYEAVRKKYPEDKEYTRRITEITNNPERELYMLYVR